MDVADGIERAILRSAEAHASDRELASYIDGGGAGEGLSLLVRGHLERCALCAYRAQAMRDALSYRRAEDVVEFEEIRIGASGGRRSADAAREVPIWEHRPFQGYDSSLYRLESGNRYLFSIKSLGSLKGKRVRIRIDDGSGEEKVIEEGCSIDSRRMALYFDGEIGPGARIRISISGAEERE
jgi:hypothetical protein